VFSITGYDVCKKFLDWLYSDSDIYLKRKFERYCEYYPEVLKDESVVV